jgi:hypothetical protein
LAIEKIVARRRKYPQKIGVVTKVRIFLEFNFSSIFSPKSKLLVWIFFFLKFQVISKKTKIKNEFIAGRKKIPDPIIENSKVRMSGTKTKEKAADKDVFSKKFSSILRKI